VLLCCCSRSGVVDRTMSNPKPHKCEIVDADISTICVNDNRYSHENESSTIVLPTEVHESNESTKDIEATTIHRRTCHIRFMRLCDKKLYVFYLCDPIDTKLCDIQRHVSDIRRIGICRDEDSLSGTDSSVFVFVVCPADGTQSTHFSSM
jgi:hypothetical protein